MSGAFDLLDLPLVYIPVRWAGIAADANGNAVETEHRVELQVEMLSEPDMQAWIREGAADGLAVERACLTERINAAEAALEAGIAGSAATVTTLAEESEDLRRRTDVATAARNLRSFRAVVKGWRGIKANGRTADFEDSNVARLISRPGFADAFGKAYVAAYRGKVETREGNSAGSPANGPVGEPTAKTSEAATPIPSPSSAS